MEAAVKLPKGEDMNEWLAVNSTQFHSRSLSIADIPILSPVSPAVDFFNEISMVYGTIGEYCTKGACPTMSAGPNYQYRWADGVKVKKPIEVSAPEYVDLLLTWYASCDDLDTAGFLSKLLFAFDE